MGKAMNEWDVPASQTKRVRTVAELVGLLRRLSGHYQIVVPSIAHELAIAARQYEARPRRAKSDAWMYAIVLSERVEGIRPDGNTYTPEQVAAALDIAARIQWALSPSVAGRAK